MSTTNRAYEKANVRSSLASFEQFNNRDFTDFEAHHSPHYTLYTTALPEPVVGLEKNLRFVEDFVKTFPDLHLRVDEVLPCGDTVTVRYTASGTRTRGFLGLPPTSVPFEFDVVIINYFEKTTRVKTWQYFDSLDILRQLEPRKVSELTGGGAAGPSSGENRGAAGPAGGRAAGTARLRPLPRIADFTFFSMPDPERSDRPVTAGGRLVALEVHRRLHRLEVRQRSHRKGWRVTNLIGGRSARIDMRWSPIPGDFVARPGAPAPATALDVARSQRLMIDDLRFSFAGASDHGFRGFGTGRTFPTVVGGRPRLLVAAVVDVLEGRGILAGRQGLVVLSGHFAPPDHLQLCVVLRVEDPGAELLTNSRLPAPRTLRDRVPEDLLLVFLGEPVPGRPPQIERRSGGRMAGVGMPQRLRLVDVGSDVHRRRGIRSKTVRREIVGEMTADAWFDPSSGSPPYAYQTSGGVLSFAAGDGEPMGTIAADAVEGRVLATGAPDAAGPPFRCGAIAPILHGTGCFDNAAGILAVDSFFTLRPADVSSLLVVQLCDPDRKLRHLLGPRIRHLAGARERNGAGL